MTKQVQRRRGTSTQHTSFTGAEGEISVNTTNKSIHVHDGLTAGGVEAARADLTNVSDANLNAALSGNTLSSLTITSVDINGGTIDGTVIGGTSAAAGTFTTVTASGDLTIADKIVHSGDTNTAIRFPAADTVTVETSGAERLRVDSVGRVGLGVTNPVLRFQVAALSSSASTIIAATETNYLADFRSSQLIYNPVDTTGTTFGFSNSNLGALSFINTTNVVIGTNGATPLAFATTNVERMRITGAGNVGIGTSSPGQALSIVRSGATAAALGIRNNTGDASIFMTGQDTGITNIAFGDQTLFDAGSISYAHTNDVMSIKSEAVLLFRTGASERMRITSTGNVGIGTTTPATTLDVNGDVTITDKIVHSGDTNTAIRFPAADTVTVETSGTERLRVDSSGRVGIGTIAPVEKLDVASGLARFANDITPATEGDGAAYFGKIGGQAFVSSISGFAVRDNGATRLTVDTSGNVGIGTASPTGLLTIGTTAPRLDFLETGGSAGFDNTIFIRDADVFSIQTRNGATFVSNDYRMTTNASGALTHEWRTGNTERMRIDASGNLGLGVTPSAWASGSAALQMPSGVAYTQYGCSQNAYFNAGYKYVTSNLASLYQQTGGLHLFYTAPSGTAGNAITFTQAMTLSGTSTNATLKLSNGTSGSGSGDGFDLIMDGTDAYVWNRENAPLLFGTNNTERARIDASGNLLVGTTSASPTSGNGVKVIPGTGAQVSIVGSADTNANLAMNVYSTGAAAYRFQVGWGGTIYATSTSITAISDASLKDNVRDLETGLDEVMALRPRRFDWKNGDGQDVAGFIAQEVESVLPDLVSDYKYNAEETKRGLKMGDMLPTLVKAIQELKAEVDSLRAQLNP